jgi:putative transposase
MPSPRPNFHPGCYYHFYNRGHSRVTIFIEPDNYLFSLKKMKLYSRQLGLSIIAYCLMPNHYHFLVRQDGEHAAGLLPQRIFNSYSKAFNQRYQHTGTLFEGHYRVKYIDNISHLLHLCRYIHGNPVKDGLVSDPDDWPYSNYQEWVQKRHGTLFDPAFVQAHFHTPEEYRHFVLADLRGRELPKETKMYLDQVE